MGEVNFGRVGAHPIAPALFDIGGVHWTIPGWIILGSLGSTTLIQHELYYSPIYVAHRTAYVRIGVHVITAQVAASIRLGIYKADIDSDNQLIPGAVVNDAGTIDASTTGEKTITITDTLSPGHYFLAMSCDIASVQTRGWLNSSGPVTPYSTSINGEEGYVVSVTVADGGAALPDPATTPDAVVTDPRLGNSVRLRT